jgi:hypothetical protein
MAILFVLTLLVVFILFALAFDAGLWYFDHRTAQNQSEAAALAAVQELPDTDTTNATDAAKQWLTKNGSGPGEMSCLEYSDRNGDGKPDTARVCVRRDSPGIFAALSGITAVRVSAAATATVGPAGFATVVPWMPIAPDPDCNDIGMTCVVDLNEDGDTADPGEETCAFEDCPFGFNPNRLYSFKGESDEYAAGNLGSIRACGDGIDDYRECITGVDSKTGEPVISTGFEVGETVEVRTAPGNDGLNTCKALTELVSLNGETPPTNKCLDKTYPCDVASTPDALTGLDAEVIIALTAPGGLANSPACEHRKVVVPLGSRYTKPGTSDREVLGLAVFYIAGWDRTNPYKGESGTALAACGTAAGGATWPCGKVWGYLLFGQDPANRFLLDQISDDPNPFAPLLIALIE